MGKYLLRRFRLILPVLMAAAVFSCRGQKSHGFNGSAMGTTYSIRYTGEKKASLQTVVEARLNEIEDVMSTWRKNSELSRLNNAPAGEWISISPGLHSVLSLALQVSEKTGGYFDVTVGPLVNAWGFGPSEKQRDKVPDAAATAAAIKATGFRKMEIRPGTIRKKAAGMYIDLSAIAKGYGVDEIGRLLEKEGIRNYMTEIGGEIRTSGRNGDIPWRIGIEKPLRQETGIEKIIQLENLSMATSGDYRNYFEKDGIYYSHTMDPVAGRPAMHKLASVSVIAGSCALADAFATGMMAMGPEKAEKFAARENLSVLFLLREGTGFTEKVAGNFSSYYSEQRGTP